jgi:hypothetical protein
MQILDAVQRTTHGGQRIKRIALVFVQTRQRPANAFENVLRVSNERVLRAESFFFSNRQFGGFQL